MTTTDVNAAETPSQPDRVEALDREWSFDVKEMGRHVRAEDPILSTIQAHLYIDHVMMELMKLAMRLPNLVRFERMNFLTKLEICAGLGVMDPSLMPPIKRLNQLRNRLAHNLKYQITGAERKKLFDSFPAHGRQLILEKPESPEEKVSPEEATFSRMFIVLVILLDLGRQEYKKYLSKRDAALANAKRVLAQVLGQPSETSELTAV
jgi:hypothetical protein